MLFYLDNWLSARPDFVIPTGPQRGRRAGLNENYARELMELHTLGVDGGYTQQDVREVARVFTGWSIDKPQIEARFVFRPRVHDPGAKIILGQRISGGGQQEGERILDLLARHPATARFISTKLVRRFVADDPPPALVERVAVAYRQADGDIVAMLRVIFAAPEFYADDALRAKIKVASASGERELDVEQLYRIPGAENEREVTLAPNEILTHIFIPPVNRARNATYEVRKRQGLDWPLAAASVSLKMKGTTVESATIALGHVAPTPWRSPEAEAVLRNKVVTDAVAAEAGEAAVARATPLSRNEYKVQLARVAVKRAILVAAGNL